MAAQDLDVRGTIRERHGAETGFSHAVYVTEEFAGGHRLEELALVFDLRLPQGAAGERAVRLHVARSTTGRP